MNAEYFYLDAEQIENAIMSQGLKHWWVAEQAGIHRTTFRRWLRGEIRRVKKENVDELAKVLKAEIELIAMPCPELDTVH